MSVLKRNYTKKCKQYKIDHPDEIFINMDTEGDDPKVTTVMKNPANLKEVNFQDENRYYVKKRYINNEDLSLLLNGLKTK